MWDEIKGTIKNYRACREFFLHLHDAYILAALASHLGATNFSSIGDKFTTVNPRKIILNTCSDFLDLLKVFKTRAMPASERDLPYENAILMVQHGILYREFGDAMKVGDSGRVEQCLLYFNLFFQGTAQHNYKFEMMNLVTSLRYTWSQGLKDFWRQNCLVSITGERDSFLADDLACEFIVRETKKEAPSSHTPANRKFMNEVAARQVLVTMQSRETVYHESGANNHFKHSSTVSSVTDVAKLTQMLIDAQVFTFTPGRTSAFSTGLDGLECDDLYGKGFATFSAGRSLKDFISKLREDDDDPEEGNEEN